MPKSKVRKKPEASVRAQTYSAPSRGLAPSPTWYPVVMAVILVIGLAYLVTYYLTSSGTDPHVPVMAGLHGWNFAVGFGIMLVGLVMAVRWR